MRHDKYTALKTTTAYDDDLVDRCSTYQPSGRLWRTYYRKCPVCGDLVGRYRSALSLHGFNRKDFPCSGTGLPWNLADDLNPCGKHPR